MNEDGVFHAEDEQQTAESFVAPEITQAITSDQLGTESNKQEINNQLYEKAKESFWLEKHGLLEPPLVNRIREASSSFLKKGSQRLLTVFGATAALAGAAYLEKDQIIESIDTIMKSPIVTEMLEQSWNQPFAVEAKDRLIGDDLKLQTENKEDGRFHSRLQQLDVEIKKSQDEHLETSGLEEQRDSIYDQLRFSPDATINLKGTKIELKEIDSLDLNQDDPRRLTDNGSRIELTDPYLQNLTAGPHPFLQPAANPARFTEFVHQETVKSLNMTGSTGTAVKGLVRDNNKEFERGDVGEFINTANEIVRSNLTYDRETAAWLEPSDKDGTTKLRWGGNNPFTAFISNDQTPVDQLLIDKKTGVCRHYAEALAMVCEELKRQYPDKFQNIYVTPLADAYQMHEYDAIYVVTNPHEAKMFVYDPTAGESKGSPSFDLFRTLYHRQIIDADLFMKLSGEYFEQGGDESWEDAAEFLTWALAEGELKAFQNCKPILERYINRATSAYREHSGNALEQNNIWKEFQEKVWPYVNEYHHLTGEQLYPLNQVAN